MIGSRFYYAHSFMSFQFKLLKTSTDTKARLGEIQTAHGSIQTPVFMPVGTYGTVKAIDKISFWMSSTHQLFSEILIISIFVLT